MHARHVRSMPTHINTHLIPLHPHPVCTHTLTLVYALSVSTTPQQREKNTPTWFEPRTCHPQPLPHTDAHPTQVAHQPHIQPKDIHVPPTPHPAPVNCCLAESRVTEPSLPLPLLPVRHQQPIACQAAAGEEGSPCLDKHIRLTHQHLWAGYRHVTQGERGRGP